MVVRYDSFALKKCMKRAGNFFVVRKVRWGGGEGYAVQICMRICSAYPAKAVTHLGACDNKLSARWGSAL